jgi:hypothetical protein
MTVLLFLALVSVSASVSAQTIGEPLRTALTPALTDGIAVDERPQTAARISGVSGDAVTIATRSSKPRLALTELRRVRVRQSDSLLNGALIGAGVGVASGLLICRATEPWQNCRDDVGPILGFAAIGAGAGIAIDALVRPTRTIYQPPGTPRPPRLKTLWFLNRDRLGLALIF